MAVEGRCGNGFEHVLLAGGIIVGCPMTVGPVDVVDSALEARRGFQRLAAEPPGLRAVGVISALAIMDIRFQSVAAAPLALLDADDGVNLAARLPHGPSHYGCGVESTTISPRNDALAGRRRHHFVVDALRVPVIPDIDLRHAGNCPRPRGDFVDPARRAKGIIAPPIHQPHSSRGCPRYGRGNKK